MKTFIVLTLLILAPLSTSFALGGCRAFALDRHLATYCTNNGTGSCRVIPSAIGETTQCYSTSATASCKKYDAFGALIVDKFEYCIIIP